MQLDPSQESAVDLMLSAPLGIVTGGPGTGKTTTTRVALDRMDERGERYLLAAPTGKAARRMEEATGRRSQTIHRLLGYGFGPFGAKGRGRGFAYGPGNPLDADVIIVDESSMIGVELGRHLLDAIESPTRIIFVGDADQLPPVDAGRIFGDVIAGGPSTHGGPGVEVARLTTLHRAAAESWVCSQSREILAGRLPDLRERVDFRWVEREDRDDALEALIDLVAGGGLEKMCGGPAGDAQVLVPQNVGRAGADVLNRRLQALLNPPRHVDPDDTSLTPGWRIGAGGGARELRLSDRVIQTVNDYQLAVMNGETGIVERVGKDELEVRFDERTLVAYDRERANRLRLAYALTTHKYQGSEIPWAIVLCHSTHTHMLTRGWLYTSVTRAKSGVVIVGDRKGLEAAVKNTRDAKRNSGLADRLRVQADGSEADESKGSEAA